MVVQDEDDIIKESLAHLMNYIDQAYVLDLGSSDHTFEILSDMALRDSRIVIDRIQNVVFHEGIRSVIFNKYRNNFNNGDWIIRADADEFYCVDPNEFIEKQLKKRETFVFLQWYYFRLTSLEVEAYESGRIDIIQDRRMSIMDRRRFYKIPVYTEPRMFQYRSTMCWPDTISFPYNAGFVAKERIPIMHFPHRDPIQMEKRFRIRSQVNRTSGFAGRHWDLIDWKKDVLNYNESTGTYEEQINSQSGLTSIPGLTSSEVYYNNNDNQLPSVKYLNHTGHLSTRIIKYSLHSFFLPILDSFHGCPVK